MRGLALLLIGAALAGGGLSAAQARKQGPARFFPDPSEILAKEIAFSRLAREKGQWAAYREMAAPDAVMFVPQQVSAPLWLKGRKDTPPPVRRDARRAYVSCDGRLAAATGTWQGAAGEQGYFTTIWRRTPKGEWQWVLDHADRLETPRDHGDALEGHVASCRGLKREAPSVANPKQAAPPLDDSLRWNYDVAADGSREIRVSIWNGAAYDSVIDDRVAAPR
ncbi:MAG: hypothetical protein B7Z20_02970 [Sphingobium sp. 32-64-5]|nr:MAG: hypothetical protein B7Z20_02970 [Sphingobium sp. 32-64-5]